MITTRHHRLWKMVCLLATSSFALPAAARARDFDVRPGFAVIDSIGDLRGAMRRGDQKIRMKPGTYRVHEAWPDDPRSVFICGGSKNTFDMRGVTIEVPTRIYRDMRGPVHSLGGYRIRGNHNTFEGATFENVGDHPPHRSLPEFSVNGDDNHFVDCDFIIRGSAPHGYGDFYGKGGGAAVRLRKHSALRVAGDRNLIEDCQFRIHTFGHGIFMQGAQETVIRNVLMRGDIRPTNEIYRETSGPAAKYDYQIMWPSWKKGQMIPRDQMAHLTEDGIRAYTRGSRDGETRRTGKITVENCTVIQMRGGITLTAAGKPATVTDCKVIDCRHGYSLPTGGVARNCLGNAAFGLLLMMPYSNRHDADIELELIPSEKEMGDHVLAAITGKGHRIRISAPSGYTPETRRPIVVGRSGGGNFTGRWSSRNSSTEALQKHHRAARIRLQNDTPHPVRVTQYAVGCEIGSRAPIADDGDKTRIGDVPKP
ncbi:MAG: hypothetical protein ACQESR_04190 [Planctomycetota bacterium]